MNKLLSKLFEMTPAKERRDNTAVRCSYPYYSDNFALPAWETAPHTVLAISSLNNVCSYYDVVEIHWGSFFAELFTVGPDFCEEKTNDHPSLRTSHYVYI